MNARADFRTSATAAMTATARHEQRGFPMMELHALLDLMVAGVFDIESDLLRLPTRGRARVALARQVAMYLAHVGCGLSLTEVGAMFERDRTTVAHACRVVERRRDDPNFDDAIDLLESIVRILVGARALTGSVSQAVPMQVRSKLDELGGAAIKL
jgi:chromosomal replication initiation ATPase DnaA